MFSLHACSVSCTSGIRSKLNNQKRNCITTKKGGNTTSPFQPRRFLPQIVSCSEKRRRPEAGVRIECVKPVYRNRALQNGKFSNIEVSPQQGGLYDKFRPHRRLPDGPHASRLPKISSFSVGGQNLRIYSNAIRPKCGPQAVYKNHEAGCSLTEESRGSSDHLSRRHFNYSFFNRDVESPQNTSHQLARIPRFSNKLREVESNSIPTNCVLGNAGGFGVNAIHITPTESCTDSKRMSPPPKHKQANYSPFVSGPRTSRGMSSSRMVCPTSLPSTTNSSDKRSSEMGELQRPGGFDTIGQIRPIMVGNDPTNPARESNCSANSRLNHLLGCFQTGVGGILGFPTDRRSLERERVSRPHKCIRTPGSILCPEVLSPDPNQQSHLSETRQYHSSLVPKQLGGHSLPATSPSSNSDLGLVREETPVSSGTAYPRQNQCGSGYRVPGETGSERLEDTTENNSTPYKGLHDRSLCLPPHTPTKTVCQLETGSERGAQRRLHDGLVESEGVCLPSVQLNSVSSSEGQEGTRDSGASGTTMDHTTLVASTDRTYCGLPGISGEQPQTTARRVQSRSDAPSFSISEVSRLENIRQRYKTMGISEKAIELLCNNTKSSTSKTYNVSWAQWSRWCSERKSDPVSCPVSDILTFLAEQFSQGKEYRSINVLRSAISSAHCHIDDKPVGQHPLIVRLMKGVSISRPPQPRYQKTWNVSVVTAHLASLGCNKTMSIKQLSQKLCMLMALTCPERSSVMASLDITYMRHYPEGVKFSHTIFRKRAHSGNLGESVYPKFTDESLCPVTCLSVYLERTKDWRAISKDKPRLFLSIKKPHKPVSSSTLSRWIKETIFQSGIKDFSFKGHSVRSASTSAARASGLSIDTIISMADWTNESTFKKFYYRPSLPVTYGTTVLSNSS